MIKYFHHTTTIWACSNFHRHARSFTNTESFVLPFGFELFLHSLNEACVKVPFSLSVQLSQ